MKTALVYQKGRISLVVEDGSKANKDDRDVLAAMTLYEGTGCWRLIDIRLCRQLAPTPYSGSLKASVFSASFHPETEEEADYAKSLLREYNQLANGMLVWCTFDGVVRGAPTIKGYSPPGASDSAGFFNRADALGYLKATQAFWNSYSGNLGDARMENPHHQPSEMALRFALFDKRGTSEIAPSKIDPLPPDDGMPRHA